MSSSGTIYSREVPNVVAMLDLSGDSYLLHYISEYYGLLYSSTKVVLTLDGFTAPPPPHLDPLLHFVLEV